LAFSLLSGLFFAPFSAQAGLFSSVLGNEVLAAGSTSASSESTENSQTMDLLQASVSPTSLNGTESASVNIVSENALLATTGPLGVSDGTADSDSSFDQISVYVVRKGDAISKIAEMFEVSVNTILWANNLKKGEAIKEGDILVILPVSGVKHMVAKGETLKSIANKYDADIFDIASFNGITEDTQLAVGDELIIPDGEMYIENSAGTSGSSKTSSSKTTKTPSKNLSGYFVNPAPGAIKTQGLHGKNAVDLGAPIGTPIKAAASGTVLVARMGWNGGYGGLIIIQHSNGIKTLYGHLSKVNVRSGQKVSQGEVIAGMGNTGHVRPSPGGNGSHLHFEVYGAKNPGATGSWKK